VYPVSLHKLTVAHLPQAITMTSQHQTGVLPHPLMTNHLTVLNLTQVSTHGHLERNRQRTIPTHAGQRRITTTGDSTMVNTSNQCQRAPHIAMVTPLTVIQRQITTMHEEKPLGKNGLKVLGQTSNFSCAEPNVNEL
jgi:hypothetical protein